MAEPSAPVGAVGHRIAVARELAGLTRRQLATRVQVSTSLTARIERGDVPASPALTAATAPALSDSMWKLCTDNLMNRRL